jgi:hypothetical protein
MLSFLGGGTRAAAFSCGVLQALHRAGRYRQILVTEGIRRQRLDLSI